MNINGIPIMWLCKNCDQAVRGDWPSHTPNLTHCRQYHKGFCKEPLRDPYTGGLFYDQLIVEWPEHQWQYVGEDNL